MNAAIRPTAGFQSLEPNPYTSTAGHPGGAAAAALQMQIDIAIAKGDFPKANEAEQAKQALEAACLDAQEIINANAKTWPELHPLARFTPMQRTPKAARWVIPGVIEHGVVTIAGARGVGKTTAILPLALATAGLHAPDYKMAPKADRWRHVIYISEHVEQAERIIAGVVECSGWGITWDDIAERLHVVESKRLPIQDITTVAGFYRKLTRIVDGVEILPLVVFDTQSACFEMANENDNSEAGKIMAALKGDFEGVPIWIVGHVAKAAIGRSDIAELTARGAGAFEADAIQNLYLVKDKDDRFLCIGKTRVEPKFGSELAVIPDFQTVTGVNEWGEPESVHLRWAAIEPMDVSRKELKAQQQEEEGNRRMAERRAAVMDTVDAAWRASHPLSRSEAKVQVKGSSTIEKADTITVLLSEGWLQEIEVPAKDRTNSKRKTFLVRLTTEEHDEWRATRLVPEAKQAIPASWRKAEAVLSEKEPIPFVLSEEPPAHSEGGEFSH